MPSRPVLDPSSTARLPGPDAMPSTRRSTGQRAHAEHVDQRVLGVAGVEGQLAADGGHPDRVAVARDPAHHALDQPALPGVVGRSEEEGVHDGQRARPHGEDVAQDPARPRSPRPGTARWPRDGCGSRCGWRRRCRRRRRSPRRSRPGPPAPGPLGRQAAQVQPGRLVRAVLAPHHGVEGQLEVVGRAAQDLADGLELVVGEAERPVQAGSSARSPAGGWSGGSAPAEGVMVTSTIEAAPGAPRKVRREAERGSVRSPRASKD